MEAIADNIARLRERIAAAAERAGRHGSNITLVAVTKTQPASAIADVLATGLLDVGENYVQEVLDKQGLLWPSEIASARWHLLGHLQSNKVKTALPLFDLIQSIDSVKLAQIIGRQTQGKTQDILLQVHLGDEQTKFGVPPAQMLDLAAEIAGIPGISLKGLMGIAPFGPDPRPYFRDIKQMFDRLPAPNRQILSVGMTGDFETAIEEGATMIRVGTAIFGPRANPVK